MICPECSQESEVIDSRGKGEYIRRRRRCLNNHRFTTYETRHKPMFVNVREMKKEKLATIVESLLNSLDPPEAA